MILELKIQNFLSFKNEVTFSFEATSDNTLENYYIAIQPDGTKLLKMAMVYGANASGKSNLIKAFEFLNDFVHELPEEKDTITHFVPFMFDRTKNEPGIFELLFYVNGKKHKYQLKIDCGTVYEEKLYYYPGTQPAIVFNRYFDDNKQISVIEFGSKIKISNQAHGAIQLTTLKNTSVLAAYNRVNIQIPEIKKVVDWFKEQYMFSITPYDAELTAFSDGKIQENIKNKKQALKFIQEADFNITDIFFKELIKPVPDNFLKVLNAVPGVDEEIDKIRKEKAIHYEETYFTHKIVNGGKVNSFPLSKERQSRGTMRFYGLSGPFFYTIENNAFLPIDEIGSALHPLLVQHFLREFLKKSKNAQLLFTTHNISLLLEKDILRKDAIWFTEKEEDGSTAMYSMAEYNIRKELSFYNAYKQGKFGAIPEFD